MNEEDREITANPSRLGKEAKIGVVVIALLLVVLGGAVVMRLGGSSSDDEVASAAEPTGTQQQRDAKSKTDKLLTGTRRKRAGRTEQPTVVPAKAASIGPPRTPETDSWTVVSDQSQAKQSGAGPSLNEPPSFVPDTPEPSGDGRYPGYALEPPTDASSPLRTVETDAQLAALGNESAIVSVAQSNDYQDVSGYASAGAAELPPYRESSQAPIRSASSQAGSPYASGGRLSTPQYQAENYRRQSAEPRRHDGSLRRHAPTSLYDNPSPRRNDGKYEVQPNDSYWTISERLYGVGAYFKALARHNRAAEKSDDQLQPGELILAPAVAELEQSYPDLCPKPGRREAMQSQSRSRTSTVSTHQSYGGGRTYTVAEGDTLFNIARWELGKASRWAEIYDLNRDVLGHDFNYLTPGTQLILPESESSDVIARPPAGTYRRY